MKPFAFLLLAILGFAATAQRGPSEGVPLAGLRLVAEEATAALETQAAGKNSNKSGKKGGARVSTRISSYGGFTRPTAIKGDAYAAARAGDLVAVELR